MRVLVCIVYVCVLFASKRRIGTDAHQVGAILTSCCDTPSPHPPLLQILAGLVEERGIEVFFKSNPAACAVLSFIVRTGNTFLGS